MAFYLENLPAGLAVKVSLEGRSAQQLRYGVLVSTRRDGYRIHSRVTNDAVYFWGPVKDPGEGAGGDERLDQ